MRWDFLLKKSLFLWPETQVSLKEKARSEICKRLSCWRETRQRELEGGGTASKSWLTVSLIVRLCKAQGKFNGIIFKQGFEGGSRYFCIFCQKAAVWTDISLHQCHWCSEDRYQWCSGRFKSPAVCPKIPTAFSRIAFPSEKLKKSAVVCLHQAQTVTE